MNNINKKAIFIITLITFVLFSNLLFAKDIGLYIPYGLFQAQDGSIYMTDTYNNRILKVDKVDKVDGDKREVVAGKGSMNGSYKDAEVLEAGFNQPLDLTVNSIGEIFITDSENHAIRKIAKGQVTTLAGNGTAGYQDGDPRQSKFNLPSGIAVDSQDNLYIADTLNHVIRKISRDGRVSTLAGKPGSSGDIDGTIVKALFNEPTDVMITQAGVIYVVDSGNHAIRKIADGKVTTVNGFAKDNSEDNTYKKGGYIDGKNAQFNFPKSVITLESGELLVADMMNNAIRKIKLSGEVVTVLNEDDGVEAPAGLLYKNKKLYVSQKWQAGLKAFILGEEKVVTTAISHAKWLEITPYAPASPVIQVWFQGNKMSATNVASQGINQEVYLPIRSLIQSVGGELKWDAEIKAAVVMFRGNKVTMPSSSSKTKITQGTLCGEIKYLEALLGLKIDWVERYRAVVVSY